MFTKSIFSTFSGSHTVSPMLISEIPANSIMSPAVTSSTSTFFKPTCVYNLAILPWYTVSSALQTDTVIPTVNLPRSTLPTPILPT